MNQPHILAFATQKGGAGKSTITTHFASALCYLYGYKVAVVDCDYPQNTLHSYRVDEQTRMQTEEPFRQRLLKQGLRPYPIYISSVEKASASIIALFEQDFDFILVDTPGTVNVVGLPELLRLVDYIFLPLEPDKGTIASTMGYMGLLPAFTQTSNPDSNLLGYYAFWNKFVKAERKAIYDKTEELFQSKGLPMLKSRVELLMTYKDNRSTMFPLPEKDLNRLGLGQLLMEVLAMVLGAGSVTPSGKVIEFTAPEAATDTTETPTDPATETK
jgi:cellulose biosynthesis protein BcsQ